jgi:hypothetical protein
MEETKIADPTRLERIAADTLHPVWRRFIQYCAQLKHGEIDRLCIQDGLPGLAESTTKKVKFTS